MRSLLRKPDLRVLFSAAVLFLCVSCITGPGGSVSDLGKYLPSASDIVGYWYAEADDTGKIFIVEQMAVKPSLLKRVKYAAFGLERTSDSLNRFTLVLSGNWTRTLLFMSLGISGNWNKISGKGEPSAYFNAGEGLWLFPDNGLMVISNYRYFPVNNDSVFVSHEFSPASLTANDTPIVWMHFFNTGLNGSLQKLDIRSLDISVYTGKTDGYTGDLTVEFTSASSRRIMTPLVKLALMPLLLEPGSQLPQTVADQQLLSLKGFSLPYKKLLQTYLPIAKDNNNMVNVE